MVICLESCERLVAKVDLCTNIIMLIISKYIMLLHPSVITSVKCEMFGSQIQD